jgi:hypothetical protein
MFAWASFLMKFSCAAIRGLKDTATVRFPLGNRPGPSCVGPTLQASRLWENAEHFKYIEILPSRLNFLAGQACWATDLHRSFAL